MMHRGIPTAMAEAICGKTPDCDFEFVNPDEASRVLLYEYQVLSEYHPVKHLLRRLYRSPFMSWDPFMAS
jgi:hypothetical protein